MVKVGTGSTGCDIFAHILTKLGDYWRGNFLVDLGCLQIVFHCETKADTQHFLAQEFDVTMMCPDIKDFHKPKVQNSATGQLEYLLQGSIFGSGFSCIDLSKQNMMRKHNKANVANFSGTTGETLRSSLIYHQVQAAHLIS